MFRILQSITFVTEAALKDVVQGKIVTFRIIMIVELYVKVKGRQFEFST
jgi:hypothetical protein